MPRSSVVLRLAGLAALLLPSLAPAQPASGAGARTVFVQGGAGEEAVRAASLGIAWALPWRSASGELTARGEVFASEWRTPRVGGGRRTLVQVGVVPVVRWRSDGGRSPWFLEGGIGLSWLDRELRTPERAFSTRLNFSDNLGVGIIFGSSGDQEVSLRWQHTSNGGVRKPNPGQDLLLVRYGHSF